MIDRVTITYDFSGVMQFVRCALINKLSANFFTSELSIFSLVSTESMDVLIAAGAFDFLLLNRSDFFIPDVLSLSAVDGSVLPTLYT